MKTSLAILALLASACVAPRLDVVPRYGQFDVDGDLGASSSGVVAENSLDEAGLEDDDGFVGGRVDLKWGMPHLVVSAQKTDHSGTGTLSAALEFDGTTIPAGATVDTDFDLGLYDALILFDLLPTDMFELALGLGVTAVDIDATFEEVGTGTTIETDELLPIPVLAVNAGVELGRLEVAALLSGLTGRYDGDELTVLDLDAFARLGLIGGEDRLRASVLLGYRRLDVDLEYEDGSDDVVLDATFDGPYVGLEFSF